MTKKGAVEKVRRYLVPKKDGGQRPVIKPKTSKRLHTKSTLQDGGNSGTERRPQPRGQDDKNTPERWKDAYFSVPMSPENEIPPIHMEKPDISVQLPTFWTVMHSLMGLYQANQGSGGYPEMGIHLIIYIDDILMTAETESRLRDQTTGIICLLENLGFVINYPKSQLQPTHTMEFLDFIYSRLNTDGAETSRAKDKEYQGGYQQTDFCGDSHSLRPLQISGETERHYPGNCSVLQIPARDSEAQRPEVHWHDDPFPHKQGRSFSGG